MPNSNPKLRTARIEQLEKELEVAYRRVHALQTELDAKTTALAFAEAKVLLGGFIAWRTSAVLPSRASGLPILLNRQKCSRAEMANWVSELEASDFFDAEWYTQKYGVVSELRGGSAEHYLRYGAGDGWDPSAKFSTLGYLVLYPDVIDSGINPLIHFLHYGLAEGRSPGLQALNGDRIVADCFA